jgi:16S rRNA (adenine1518-N6/adenine1519-N6)-dimethyltransferase
MDKSPSLLNRTKTLLRRYGIRTKKGLGQNFLIDSAVLKTIVTAAALSKDDTVIEVGPGLGILTAALAERAAWVIAIELDDRLAVVLRQTLPYDNVVILNQDVLGADSASLLRQNAPRFPPTLRSYKVVANLPYYITSPVLRHFLEAPVRPQSMVVMVQREVAEAIVAGAGQRSLLSIAVQFYGRPEIVAVVPAAAFFPAPEVDSAVVKISMYPHPPLADGDVAGFFKLVKAGFSAARKQIANSLSHSLGLSKEDVAGTLVKASIEPTRRAETLSVEEWVGLWLVYNEVVR